MSQRAFLRMTGAAAVVFAALAVQALAQQQSRSEKPGHSERNEALDSCAKACNDCQRSCDTCATHCAHLVAQGEKEHLRTLQTCQDCAGICSTAAQIVARHGPFTDLISRSCAEACARCRKACEQHASDKIMKLCAEECRRCEQACREVLQHTGYGAERPGR